MDGVTPLPPVNVPGEGFYTWATQWPQYPKLGPPGLGYVEHIVEVGTSPTLAIDPRDGVLKVAVARIKASVDCLLLRNRKGALVGILNHYPVDIHEMDGVLLESAGNVNVWVRPNRRHRGLATILVAEADRRWAIDWHRQSYTAGGRALIERYLASTKEAP